YLQDFATLSPSKNGVIPKLPPNVGIIPNQEMNCNYPLDDKYREIASGKHSDFVRKMSTFDATSRCVHEQGVPSCPGQRKKERGGNRFLPLVSLLSPWIGGGRGI
ncbi:MAG: hypothetical protein Q4G65_18565, partial [bacterium]|nr:hypothetical protein [bacterium]